jgi:hypothetical protein
MATVYTIEGPSLRDGDGCRRVRHGKKRGCTIALCPGKSKRGKRVMKFKKGSVRCS